MAGVRLLIVDDERDLAESLSMALAARGYTCDILESGFGMMSALDESKPDVLLLDLQMPGIDGDSLAHRLRLAGRRVPIVFWSGIELAALAETARRHGAGFVHKPASIDAVVRALELGVGRTAREDIG